MGRQRYAYSAPYINWQTEILWCWEDSITCLHCKTTADTILGGLEVESQVKSSLECSPMPRHEDTEAFLQHLLSGGSNVLHGNARDDMFSAPDKKLPRAHSPVPLDLEGMSEIELALHLVQTKKSLKDLKDRSDNRKAGSKKQKLTAKAAEKEVGWSLVPPPLAPNSKKASPAKKSSVLQDLQAVGARAAPEEQAASEEDSE